MSEMSENKPTFWQIVVSTLGAAFGVQSSKTYERDSDQKSIAPYLTAGLIFTTLFIFILVTIVKIILNSAGA
ncbi:DUF2970 domain-containing protein [Gilvimarinus sp. F26214L]|uniref:DUF2970 domain-containing protein n=1 Tax=Gilvimarinus sp. DZF01 TaxID=3461371 RepID=UPI004045BB0E